MLGESYDYRVDIWSLGVLMFELLTGKAPFDAEETEELGAPTRPHVPFRASTFDGPPRHFSPRTALPFVGRELRTNGSRTF